MSSVLAVPGITNVDGAFLRVLAYIAAKNGWNVDGVAAVISHESGFDPHARNPHGTATGLIQMIESTAESLGTTTAALLGMTAVQQLVYVERFFVTYLHGLRPSNPEDYILVTYGRLDAIGKPDDYVLDRADSDDPAERRRYEWNAALDSEGKGYITAGDLRGSLGGTIRAAGGRRVEVPPKGAPPGAPGGDGGGFGLLVVGVVGAVAVWAARKAWA